MVKTNYFYKILANTSATTASVTTQENNSFMSNVMLLSPLNDDGSNSLTSTPSVAMETDQSVYDLQKDMQQRSAGESHQSIYFHLTGKYNQNIHRLFFGFCFSCCCQHNSK